MDVTEGGEQPWSDWDRGSKMAAVVTDMAMCSLSVEPLAPWAVTAFTENDRYTLKAFCGPAMVLNILPVMSGILSSSLVR